MELNNLRSFRVFEGENLLLKKKYPERFKNRGECCKRSKTYGQFASNSIKTSKYSILSFLPKNLMEQFSQLANLYFLGISIMQMLPQVSITKGVPMELLPLGFIVLVTMLKDLFEDRKRQKQDNEENSRSIEIFNPDLKVFEQKKWRDLRVG